jgi:hypothetical protein
LYESGKIKIEFPWAIPLPAQNNPIFILGSGALQHLCISLKIPAVSLARLDLAVVREVLELMAWRRDFFVRHGAGAQT